MFSASSFFAPTYQSSLINKHDQVFFSFSPFLSSSSSRRLRARTPPPPSTFASAPAKAAASTCPDQRTATHLRCSAAPVRIPLLEYQICIRVSAFFRVLHSSSRFLRSSSAAVSFDPKVVRNSCGSCFASVFNTSRSILPVKRPP